MHAHASIDDVLAALHAERRGLDDAEVERRRAEHGWNELPEKHRSSLLLFLRQFKDIVVYILVVALVLSVVLRLLEGRANGFEDLLDAIFILIILLLNAALGFVQEYKAEEAIAALRTLTAPQVRVRRDGKELMIPSRALVPGDIVVVESGDRIAADGCIVAASHVEMNESSLTGESLAVSKQAVPVARASSIADQTDMLFAGTHVTRGSAEYVVTAIGLHTEIGKIADIVSRTELPETPLAARMRRLSGVLGIVVLCLCAVVVGVGIARRFDLLSILLLAVSLAVSAVPEGLPAVVTATLAVGVRRMAARKAFVRQLDALETLGSVTVICSDKTGTITENRMTVREVWVADDGPGERALAIRIAASCNRAVLPDLGDPTELGLLQFAEQERVERLLIDEEEVPFTSEEKYMQTRHAFEEHGKKRIVSFLKGAPETIAAHTGKTSLLERSAEMSARGLRVLGLAVRDNDTGKPRFVGLVGMEDPVRAGVREAFEEAERAGIRTIMITGDSPETAAAVAREVGIGSEVMRGEELDTLKPAALRTRLKTVSVFARVSPLHKMQILSVLQKNGEVVAMTGDGVNDAPALKAAHVGVAMGRVGTQVAKEAASVVLADDDYATIVLAIREGRRIYDNIRKFVLYLLRANVGQMLFITASLIAGLPLPFLPLQILWINLMTDGLPALALGAEQAEEGIMRRPPRPANESIFAGEWVRFAVYAFTAFLLQFVTFAWLLAHGVEEQRARTLLFTLAILFELLLAFTTRSNRPLWEIGFFSNRFLLGAVMIPLLLQFALLYTPLRGVFMLVPLTLGEWEFVTGLALATFLVLEFLKMFRISSMLESALSRWWTARGDKRRNVSTRKTKRV